MFENLIQVSIKNLKVGNILINLGEVLEIEKQSNCFSVVISRNNEKQVFKFFEDQKLLIVKHNILVDDPTNYLLSDKVKPLVESMFTISRKNK